MSEIADVKVTFKSGAVETFVVDGDRPLIELARDISQARPFDTAKKVDFVWRDEPRKL